MASLPDRGAPARRGRDRLRPFCWGGAALLLLLSAVAMRLGAAGVDWDATDFIVMGVMLATACGLYELAAWRSGSMAYRAGFGLAVLAGFLTVWVNLAVGMYGLTGAQDKKDDAKPSLAEKIQAIQKELQEAQSPLLKEFQAAKTDKDKEVIREKAMAMMPKFAEKIVAAVSENPKDPAALAGEYGRRPGALRRRLAKPVREHPVRPAAAHRDRAPGTATAPDRISWSGAVYERRVWDLNPR